MDETLILFHTQREKGGLFHIHSYQWITNSQNINKILSIYTLEKVIFHLLQSEDTRSLLVFRTLNRCLKSLSLHYYPQVELGVRISRKHYDTGSVGRFLSRSHRGVTTNVPHCPHRRWPYYKSQRTSTL